MQSQTDLKNGNEELQPINVQYNLLHPFAIYLHKMLKMSSYTHTHKIFFCLSI